MASSGFRGFRGYFQESEHLRGFARFVARGYFVDFLVTRGFIRGDGLIPQTKRRPKTAL